MSLPSISRKLAAGLVLAAMVLAPTVSTFAAVRAAQTRPGSALQEAATAAHFDHDGPLNYDTQVLAIFRAAAGEGGPVQVGLEHGTLQPVQRMALRTIYEKLKHHQMFMKNVVWRPDLKVIRITWGSAHDAYVFKVVYRVSHDPVLTNSIYANKNEILDVKIMYLDGSRYRYLHLNHGGPVSVLPSGEVLYRASPTAPASPAQPHLGLFGYYALNAHVSAQECKFCHMLVRGVGGKPGGVFFPRYQEAESSLDADYRGAAGASSIEQPLFFRQSDFHPIDPSRAPVALPAGLPNPILFDRVSLVDPATRKLYTMYVRTMFEAPQLVEAMARDNHESVCISVDFSAASPLFGKDNYVCADGVRKRLFVRFRNPLLSTGSGKVSYSKPYYAAQ